MDFEGLSALTLIAERRIAEAMSEGRFDNLPGRGRPQELEDLSHLAPEMRLAYIILKNSGFLEDGAGRAVPEGDWAKLERLRFKMARASGRPASDPLEEMDPAYVEKLLGRVS
jgi:hypothetical protein